MKFYSLLAVMCLFLAFGCDKEDPVTPQVPIDEVVKEELTEALASQSDLAGFVTAFEKLDLQPEDVEDGITIFAPADNADNAGGRAAASEITDEELKGHIVKTLINAANLKDGDILVALNGKLLVVKVSGDEITVNGVPLTSKDLAAGEKYVVHKIREILQYPEEGGEKAGLTVTVYNSTKWSPEKPKGEPEAGVMVSLYASHGAYADGVPVKTQETNADGEAVFADLEAGTNYFIVAQKGDLSNIFNQSLQPVGGVYQGFKDEGLFQTLEEIANHATQPGAHPGDFRFADVNADGIINIGDAVPVPSQETTPLAGDVELDVTIGYVTNSQMVVRNGADALEKLQAARQAVSNFHKDLAMIDGTLSDDTDWDCGAGATLCQIDNFTFTPSNPAFTTIWNRAYGGIGTLNLLLRDVPALSFAEKDVVLGEAKGLRAYVYLQLATYFGDVPLMQGLKLSDESRTPKNEVLALVEDDLNTAVSALPLGNPENSNFFTSSAANVLLARLALLNGEYDKVLSALSEVQGGQYNLIETNEGIFIAAPNTEIIWNSSFGLSPEFSEYFFARTFCPELRLGEVYLMQAEAELETGMLEQSTNNINMIRIRNGMEPTSGGQSQADLRAALRETWQVDMSREGTRFANLVRWGIAQDVLGAKGYNLDKHSLLPVPQVYMDNHSNLTQNPSY